MTKPPVQHSRKHIAQVAVQLIVPVARYMGIDTVQGFHALKDTHLLKSIWTNRALPNASGITNRAAPR